MTAGGNQNNDSVTATVKEIKIILTYDQRQAKNYLERLI
jgi:hypothetical protein